MNGPGAMMEQMPPEQMQGEQSQLPPGIEGASDEELVEFVALQLVQYIHKGGRQTIVQELQSGQELHEVIGTITYGLVKQAADQGEQDGIALDQDMLIGVATEVIDELFDLAKSLKVEGDYTEDGKAAALMQVMQIHGQSMEGDPEAQAMAQEDLAGMIESGEVDEAQSFFQRFEE